MAETAKSISTEEAKDRHQKFLYGYNEITEKKEVRCSNFWIIFALLLFTAVAGF